MPRRQIILPVELHRPMPKSLSALQSLRRALEIVLPEFSNLYLQYHPKLQLMVSYQGKTMQFQQLSNSIRNLVALIGDIVRTHVPVESVQSAPLWRRWRYLPIDAIDHQLDQNMAQSILPRLHQAFPRLQIIATGNRLELLEQASGLAALN